jgi:hypothetical protein
MRRVKNSSICLLFIALVAEVLASLAVWSGTPTDWSGEPLHFWAFETLRLRYWCVFGLLVAGLWVAGYMSRRRRSAVVIVLILGAICSLGAEVVTSICFWKALTSTQTMYLGWPVLKQYVVEHLISWIVVWVLGLASWYLYVRRRRAKLLASGVVRI